MSSAYDDIVRCVSYRNIQNGIENRKKDINKVIKVYEGFKNEEIKYLFKYFRYVIINYNLFNNISNIWRFILNTFPTFKHFIISYVACIVCILHLT